MAVACSAFVAEYLVATSSLGRPPVGVEEVAAGTSPQYVAVRGEYGGYVIACDRELRVCDPLFILTDPSSHTAIFVRTGDEADWSSEQGYVTAKGEVTRATDTQLLAWRSAARDSGAPHIPESAYFLNLTWHAPPLLPSLVGSLIAFASVLMLTVGWVSGFVAFVPLKGERPRTVSRLGSLPPSAVRVTGTLVGSYLEKRRYRDRPATLGIQDGCLNLSVHDWNAGPKGLPSRIEPADLESMPPLDGIQSVVSDAEPTEFESRIPLADIRSAVSGTARLVLSSPPAVSAGTPNGRLLLVFDSDGGRDQFLSALAGGSV
jgi:hypothetical protein